MRYQIVNLRLFQSARLFLTAAMIVVPAMAALGQKASQSESPFRFAAVSTESLGLWENRKPVFVYNHGIIKKEGVPADRFRSSYVHPLYGLDGEVLTDDFPKDHYHHRGLFWAWPHVGIGGKEYDMWMLKGIRHEFVRWLKRSTTADTATLMLENGWYVESNKVAAEQVLLRVHRSSSNARMIDVELTLTPVQQAITLQGAEGKSYGGLTLRYAPREETIITVPSGKTKEDLSMAPLPWADLTAKFAGTAERSGATIFISPSHPDFPPTWLTRHYGCLCVGWPGVNGQTFPPGKPITLKYRVQVHRGQPSAHALEKAFQRSWP